MNGDVKLHELCLSAIHQTTKRNKPYYSFSVRSLRFMPDTRVIRSIILILNELLYGHITRKVVCES